MRSIARYRAWALREPFVLLCDDGTTITIRRPDADRLLSLPGATTTLGRLAVLAGKEAAELVDVVGTFDMQVAKDITEDLAEHFGCTDVTRLVHLLDRYGAAIAADLHQVYDLDMLDVFRGEILPDELMERIDNLPRHSRFAEAMAQDDELAEFMGDLSSSSGGGVRFSEWNPETERLTIIANILDSILSALTSFAGGTYSNPPLPRPKGAQDRLEERKSDDEYQDLLADVREAQERWRQDHKEG